MGSGEEEDLHPLRTIKRVLQKTFGQPLSLGILLIRINGKGGVSRLQNMNRIAMIKPT
jgi:hypothetical protein